ncbi:T9SS type A sorting domain-containing protein [Candidatus Kapabacteria bacterium]|nr:T9SS type A sorting domain-containing protein [Candidatus Kapabacteria bacterium]
MKNIIIIAILGFACLSKLKAEEITPLWKSNYDSWDVDFSPNGELLAIGMGDSWGNAGYFCYIVDPFTGEVLHQLKNKYPRVTEVVFSPDGKELTTYSKGAFYFWNTETWELTDSLIFTQETHPGWDNYETRYSHNGEYLIVASGETGLCVINRSTFETKFRDDNEIYHVAKSGIQYKSGVEFVSTSYDDKYIMASILPLDEVIIYDFETLEQVKKYEYVYRGEFNPKKDEYLIQNMVELPQHEIKFYSNVDFFDFEHNKINSFYKFNSTSIYTYLDSGNDLVTYHGTQFVTLIDLNNMDNYIVFNDIRGGYCKINQYSMMVIPNVRVFDLSNYLGIENAGSNPFILSPNPANNQINISYTFESPAEYNINISDVTGNNLGVIDSGYGSGEYLFQYNCEQLPIGTYFITLSINGDNITKQIQIMR